MYFYTQTNGVVRPLFYLCIYYMLTWEYRAKPFCLSGVVRNVLCFDMQRCQADLIYIISH
jgi:hypothetical protein